MTKAEIEERGYHTDEDGRVLNEFNHDVCDEEGQLEWEKEDEVNHYNKGGAYVIEFTGKNIEKEFGHLYKKEEK